LKKLYFLIRYFRDMEDSGCCEPKQSSKNSAKLSGGNDVQETDLNSDSREQQTEKPSNCRKNAEERSETSDSEPRRRIEVDDELDFRPPLVRITEWKKTGNNFFRERSYQEAIAAYSRGLDIKTEKEETEISQDGGAEREETSTLDEEEPSAEDIKIKLMRSQLFSNRAACFLGLKDWLMAKKDSTEALKLEPNYVKALTRRGTANEELKKYEEALKDFKRVMELEPRNYAVLKKIPGLEKKHKEQFEKQKEEMITNLKGMGNWVLNKFGMSVDDFEAKQGPDGSWSVGMKNKQPGGS